MNIKPMIAICMLFVAGCSSPASEIHYYQLSTAPAKVIHNKPVTALAIAPVKVASYLNGSGLVVQQSAVEFSIARQHLWADSLEQQLQRQLTEFITLALPALQLVPINTPDALNLQVEIDRFYATEQGQALLSGRYTVTGNGKHHTKPFSYQVPLAANGYPAMVSALSDAWQQLLQDIPSALQVE